MKKLIISFAAFVLAIAAGFAEELSYVDTNGSWIYLYNTQGKKYKTLSVSSVGTVLGNSSTFFVARNGTWIYLYDSEGRKYKTLSVSTVGEVLSVSGNTFTSRNGNWIYTWSKDGTKISTRSAR